MGLKLDPATLVKEGKRHAVTLGDLSKVDTRWRVGLGWDDSDIHGEIDVDLWLCALTSGEAVELVRYNEKDETATVTSASGGLIYLGDARSGKKVKRGDDEKAIIDFPKLRAVGIDRVLVLAGIYKPGGLTFDQVNNAYVRTFPLSVLVDDPTDRDEPEKVSDMSKVKAIELTTKGQGTRTVIFGWFEYVGPGDSDWEFVNQPSHAPDIASALAPFGVG